MTLISFIFIFQLFITLVICLPFKPSETVSGPDNDSPFDMFQRTRYMVDNDVHLEKSIYYVNEINVKLQESGILDLIEAHRSSVDADMNALVSNTANSMALMDQGIIHEVGFLWVLPRWSSFFKLLRRQFLIDQVKTELETYFDHFIPGHFTGKESIVTYFGDLLQNLIKSQYSGDPEPNNNDDVSPLHLICEFFADGLVQYSLISETRRVSAASEVRSELIRVLEPVTRAYVEFYQDYLERQIPKFRNMHAEIWTAFYRQSEIVFQRFKKELDAVVNYYETNNTSLDSELFKEKLMRKSNIYPLTWETFFLAHKVAFAAVMDSVSNHIANVTADFMAKNEGRGAEVLSLYGVAERVCQETMSKIKSLAEKILEPHQLWDLEYKERYNELNKEPNRPSRFFMRPPARATKKPYVRPLDRLRPGYVQMKSSL